MLQLINLFFTKAKVSKVAFQDWKQIEQNLYQHPIGDLKYLDLNVLGKNAINDHSGVTYGTARFKGLEKTDINQGFKMYNKVFGNIEEFTFLVSGNFNPEVLLPLLNKYLGSIPNSSDIPSKNPPKKNTLPSGPIFQEFSFPDAYNKNNIMYMPKYIKSKDTLDDWKERIRVEALGAVTNSKVWGLRFDKGYSLYITGTSGKENYEMDRYEINTSFDCVPDELPFIKKEFNIIINDLRKKLVSPDHLQQGLNRMKMLYNPKGRGNSQRAMQEKLYKHYRFGSKWISNGKILQFINSLTPKDILEAANKYYQKNNYYQFVLKSD
ncbi:insulinase family protein [Salegentibacter sp. LM13S]|uniref:insulinase family protein n=1 Tax=Salegentibacter lacus TaxID=2873599 RepID=UPI001CC9C4BB|nr:insulinase family protein [Salegentibacter lacus]MBZ9629142.1 insulinase family protein [Salegentibacter lacus]